MRLVGHTVIAAGLLSLAQNVSPPVLQLDAKGLAAEHYLLVTEVSKLPADVRDALAFQLDVKELRMADAGKPFDESGKGTSPPLPDRRLIVAAIGSRFSVVHFERGGNPYPWVIILEKLSKGFSARLHAPIVRTYRDPKAFEQAIKTGELWKPQRSLFRQAQ